MISVIYHTVRLQPHTTTQQPIYDYGREIFRLLMVASNDSFEITAIAPLRPPPLFLRPCIGRSRIDIRSCKLDCRAQFSPISPYLYVCMCVLIQSIAVSEWNAVGGRLF